MPGCDLGMSHRGMFDAQLLVAEAARYFDGSMPAPDELELHPREHDHEPTATAGHDLAA